jgi:TRAP-type uncharacterized transport system fused permease subunit
MKSLQILLDKTAIGLSIACTFHCLILPFLLVFLPSLVALPLQNEAFHLWMIVAVVPTSMYALTVGCKQHKRYSLLALGAVGICFLVLALLLGERWEKLLTTIGAVIIAFGHLRNYRLCAVKPDCECGEGDMVSP